MAQNTAEHSIQQEEATVPMVQNSSVHGTKHAAVHSTQ